jgi:hypothetical protein
LKDEKQNDENNEGCIRFFTHGTALRGSEETIPNSTKIRA